MYLFNEKGKVIEVYQMVPQEELMAEYRKKELEEKIPSDERVYYATSTSGKPLLKRTELNSSSLNYRGDLEPNFFRSVHTFRPMDFHIKENEQLEESFTHGAYDSNDAVRVVDKGQYFILPAGGYAYQQYAREYWMKGIIQVPESLYLLHLLNQGKFAAVAPYDIDEQLGLYEVGVDPVYALDVVTMEHMHESGLIAESVDDMMGKVRETEGILKRVRKSQGYR